MMLFLRLTESLLFCFALFCLAYARSGREYIHENDVEAWARREYFYVGGQYVQTTLVCSFSMRWSNMRVNGLIIHFSQRATRRRRT